MEIDMLKQNTIINHNQHIFFLLPVNSSAPFWIVAAIMYMSLPACKLQRPQGCCSSASHNQCRYFQLSANEFL